MIEFAHACLFNLQCRTILDVEVHVVLFVNEVHGKPQAIKGLSTERNSCTRNF